MNFSISSLKRAAPLKSTSTLLATLFLTLGATTRAAVRYVDLNSASPTPPYTNWTTAATNIQDAVNAAGFGDQILVTNGVYQSGGIIRGVDWNAVRVFVPRGVRVESVNGPAVTSIVGYQLPATTNGVGAVRCAYLEEGAVLAGFTLTNGATEFRQGGGVYCQSELAFVSNCVITGNAAGAGGGSYRGTLQNCTLKGNTVDFPGVDGMGGGAFGGTLNNCVLMDNRAVYGGGAAGLNGDLRDNCSLNNCILVGNRATYGGGAAYIVLLSGCTLRGNSAIQGGGIYGPTQGRNCLLTGNQANLGSGAYEGWLVHCTVAGNAGSTPWTSGVYDTALRDSIVFNNTNRFGLRNELARSMNYCCTTFMPDAGVGNITNAPLFVDPTNGNFRLQFNSPCINAGQPGVGGLIDLDGNPRMAGGTVDMGAYEFQSPTSVLSYAWLQQYGLPTDGSADYADSDGDLMNNWQEWIAGTIPTDAASALRLLSPSPGPAGTVVTWQSVANRTYFLERATNLGAAPSFSLVSSNLVGQTGTTTFTDINATGAGPFYYRVGVNVP